MERRKETKERTANPMRTQTKNEVEIIASVQKKFIMMLGVKFTKLVNG